MQRATSRKHRNKNNHTHHNHHAHASSTSSYSQSKHRRRRLSTSRLFSTTSQSSTLTIYEHNAEENKNKQDNLPQEVKEKLGALQLQNNMYENLASFAVLYDIKPYRQHIIQLATNLENLQFTPKELLLLYDNNVPISNVHSFINYKTYQLRIQHLKQEQERQRCQTFSPTNLTAKTDQNEVPNVDTSKILHDFPHLKPQPWSLPPELFPSYAENELEESMTISNSILQLSSLVRIYTNTKLKNKNNCKVYATEEDFTINKNDLTFENTIIPFELSHNKLQHLNNTAEVLTNFHTNPHSKETAVQVGLRTGHVYALLISNPTIHKVLVEYVLNNDEIFNKLDKDQRFLLITIINRIFKDYGVRESIYDDIYDFDAKHNNNPILFKSDGSGEKHDNFNVMDQQHLIPFTKIRTFINKNLHLIQQAEIQYIEKYDNVDIDLIETYLKQLHHEDKIYDNKIQDQILRQRENMHLKNRFDKSYGRSGPLTSAFSEYGEESTASSPKNRKSIDLAYIDIYTISKEEVNNTKIIESKQHLQYLVKHRDETTKLIKVLTETTIPTLLSSYDAEAAKDGALETQHAKAMSDIFENIMALVDGVISAKRAKDEMAKDISTLISVTKSRIQRYTAYKRQQAQTQLEVEQTEEMLKQNESRSDLSQLVVNSPINQHIIRPLMTVTLQELDGIPKEIIHDLAVKNQPYWKQQAISLSQNMKNMIAADDSIQGADNYKIWTSPSEGHALVLTNSRQEYNYIMRYCHSNVLRYRYYMMYHFGTHNTMGTHVRQYNDTDLDELDEEELLKEARDSNNVDKTQDAQKVDDNGNPVVDIIGEESGKKELKYEIVANPLINYLDNYETKTLNMLSPHSIISDINSILLSSKVPKTIEEMKNNIKHINTVQLQQSLQQIKQVQQLRATNEYIPYEEDLLTIVADSIISLRSLLAHMTKEIDVHYTELKFEIKSSMYGEEITESDERYLDQLKSTPRSYLDLVSPHTLLGSTANIQQFMKYLYTVAHHNMTFDEAQHNQQNLLSYEVNKYLKELKIKQNTKKIMDKLHGVENDEKDRKISDADTNAENDGAENDGTDQNPEDPIKTKSMIDEDEDKSAILHYINKYTINYYNDSVEEFQASQIDYTPYVNTPTLLSVKQMLYSTPQMAGYRITDNLRYFTKRREYTSEVEKKKSDEALSFGIIDLDENGKVIHDSKKQKRDYFDINEDPSKFTVDFLSSMPTPSITGYELNDDMLANEQALIDQLNQIALSTVRFRQNEVQYKAHLDEMNTLVKSKGFDLKNYEKYDENDEEMENVVLTPTRIKICKVLMGGTDHLFEKDVDEMFRETDVIGNDEEDYDYGEKEQGEDMMLLFSTMIASKNLKSPEQQREEYITDQYYGDSLHDQIEQVKNDPRYLKKVLILEWKKFQRKTYKKLALLQHKSDELKRVIVQQYYSYYCHQLKEYKKQVDEEEKDRLLNGPSDKATDAHQHHVIDSTQTIYDDQGNVVLSKEEERNIKIQLMTQLDQRMKPTVTTVFPWEEDYYRHRFMESASTFDHKKYSDGLDDSALQLESYDKHYKDTLTNVVYNMKQVHNQHLLDRVFEDENTAQKAIGTNNLAAEQRTKVNSLDAHVKLMMAKLPPNHPQLRKLLQQQREERERLEQQELENDKILENQNISVVEKTMTETVKPLLIQDDSEHLAPLELFTPKSENDDLVQYRNKIFSLFNTYQHTRLKQDIQREQVLSTVNVPYNEEEITAYFPLPYVIHNMIFIFETLFNINITQQPSQFQVDPRSIGTKTPSDLISQLPSVQNAINEGKHPNDVLYNVIEDVWDRNVLVFKFKDGKSRVDPDSDDANKPESTIYLDLFNRPSKTSIKSTYLDCDYLDVYQNTTLGQNLDIYNPMAKFTDKAIDLELYYKLQGEFKDSLANNPLRSLSNKLKTKFFFQLCEVPIPTSSLNARNDNLLLNNINQVLDQYVTAQHNNIINLYEQNVGIHHLVHNTLDDNHHDIPYLLPLYHNYTREKLHLDQYQHTPQYLEGLQEILSLSHRFKSKTYYEKLMKPTKNKLLPTSSASRYLLQIGVDNRQDFSITTDELDVLEDRYFMDNVTQHRLYSNNNPRMNLIINNAIAQAERNIGDKKNPYAELLDPAVKQQKLENMTAKYLEYATNKQYPQKKDLHQAHLGLIDSQFMLFLDDLDSFEPINVAMSTEQKSTSWEDRDFKKDEEGEDFISPITVELTRTTYKQQKYQLSNLGNEATKINQTQNFSSPCLLKPEEVKQLFTQFGNAVFRTLNHNGSNRYSITNTTSLFKRWHNLFRNSSSSANGGTTDSYDSNASAFGHSLGNKLSWGPELEMFFNSLAEAILLHDFNDKFGSETGKNTSTFISTNNNTGNKVLLTEDYELNVQQKLLNVIESYYDKQIAMHDTDIVAKHEKDKRPTNQLLAASRKKNDKNLLTDLSTLVLDVNNHDSVQDLKFQYSSLFAPKYESNIHNKDYNMHHLLTHHFSYINHGDLAHIYNIYNTDFQHLHQKYNLQLRNTMMKDTSLSAIVEEGKNHYMQNNMKKSTDQSEDSIGDTSQNKSFDLQSYQLNPFADPSETGVHYKSKQARKREWEENHQKIEAIKQRYSIVLYLSNYFQTKQAAYWQSTLEKSFNQLSQIMDCYNEIIEYYTLLTRFNSKVLQANHIDDDNLFAEADYATKCAVSAELMDDKEILMDLKNYQTLLSSSFNHITHLLSSQTALHHTNNDMNELILSEMKLLKDGSGTIADDEEIDANAPQHHAQKRLLGADNEFGLLYSSGAFNTLTKQQLYRDKITQIKSRLDDRHRGMTDIIKKSRMPLVTTTSMSTLFNPLKYQSLIYGINIDHSSSDELKKASEHTENVSQKILFQRNYLDLNGAQSYFNEASEFQDSMRSINMFNSHINVLVQEHNREIFAKKSGQYHNSKENISPQQWAVAKRSMKNYHKMNRNNFQHQLHIILKKLFIRYAPKPPLSFYNCVARQQLSNVAGDQHELAFNALLDHNYHSVEYIPQTELTNVGATLKAKMQKNAEEREQRDRARKQEQMSNQLTSITKVTSQSIQLHQKQREISQSKNDLGHSFAQQQQSMMLQPYDHHNTYNYSANNIYNLSKGLVPLQPNRKQLLNKDIYKNTYIDAQYIKNNVYNNKQFVYHMMKQLKSPETIRLALPKEATINVLQFFTQYLFNKSSNRLQQQVMLKQAVQRGQSSLLLDRLRSKREVMLINKGIKTQDNVPLDFYKNKPTTARSSAKKAASSIFSRLSDKLNQKDEEIVPTSFTPISTDQLNPEIQQEQNDIEGLKPKKLALPSLDITQQNKKYKYLLPQYVFLQPTLPQHISARTRAKMYQSSLLIPKSVKEQYEYKQSLSSTSLTNNMYKLLKHKLTLPVSPLNLERFQQLIEKVKENDEFDENHRGMDGENDEHGQNDCNVQDFNQKKTKPVPNHLKLYKMFLDLQTTITQDFPTATALLHGSESVKSYHVDNGRILTENEQCGQYYSLPYASILADIVYTTHFQAPLTTPIQDATKPNKKTQFNQNTIITAQHPFNNTIFRIDNNLLFEFQNHNSLVKNAAKVLNYASVCKTSIEDSDNNESLKPQSKDLQVKDIIQTIPISYYKSPYISKPTVSILQLSCNNQSLEKVESFKETIIKPLRTYNVNTLLSKFMRIASISTAVPEDSILLPPELKQLNANSTAQRHALQYHKHLYNLMLESSPGTSSQPLLDSGRINRSVSFGTGALNTETKSDQLIKF